MNATRLHHLYAYKTGGKKKRNLLALTNFAMQALQTTGLIYLLLCSSDEINTAAYVPSKFSDRSCASSSMNRSIEN